MKRRSKWLGALLIIALSLCSCGDNISEDKKTDKEEQINVSDQDDSEVNEEDTEQYVEQDSEQNDDPNSVNDETLPEDGVANGRMLFSLGKKPIYSGCDIQAVLDAGFEADENDLNQTVQPNARASVHLYDKNDGINHENVIYVTNLSGSATQAGDCTVSHISMGQGMVYFGTGDKIDHNFRCQEAPLSDISDTYGKYYEREGGSMDPFDYIMYGNPANYAEFTINDDVVSSARAGYIGEEYDAFCQSLLDDNPDADWNRIFAAGTLKHYVDFDTEVYLDGEGPRDAFSCDGTFTVEGTTLTMWDYYAGIPDSRRISTDETISGYCDSTFNEKGLIMKLRNSSSSDISYDDGQIISIKSYVDEENCSMSVMGIDKDSTIDDIISKLGEPTQLEGSYLENTVEMVYCASGYRITYGVDPVQNDVKSIMIEVDED